MEIIMLSAFPQLFLRFGEFTRRPRQAARRMATAYWRDQHLRALRHVDDRLLADLGLTRSELDVAIRDMRPWP
jgi:uncharacterized protein YjiS (DUF1127 family)